MAIFAWVFGSLGGLCAITGILAATEAIPELAKLPAAFTPMFWLAISIVLMLTCIAFAVGSTEYE